MGVATRVSFLRWALAANLSIETEHNLTEIKVCQMPWLIASVTLK